MKLSLAKVTYQGAVRVNHAAIYKQTSDTALILVDLHSKYCVIDATGSDDRGPSIFVGTNKNSLNLHKTRKGLTEILFPAFKGWYVWCCQLQKYTVSICMMKE